MFSDEELYRQYLSGDETGLRSDEEHYPEAVLIA